ncbi:MAG: DNA polymerase III subunit alpha [Burkholderiales bacterium]|nr:DNA polymerase III subunit alpha [Burkholderiales bacterium]
MAQDFVHLRMHSEYSFKDSTIRVKEIVHKASGAGMNALALSDAGVMFGHVFFYKAALAQGIKPILAVDAWVSNPLNRENPHKLLLLCRNLDGYHSICKLLTKAWLKNQVDEKGIIEMKWLNKENCSGLIALSGFESGSIGRALLNGKMNTATEEAKKLSSLFKDRFYLEIQRAGRKTDEKLVALTAKFAKEQKLPLVATHPIQFTDPEDFLDHEIRCCIAQSTTLADPSRERKYTKDMYFKSKEEMIEKFKDYPSALQNSVEIAKRCNVQLDLGHPRLPKFETPAGTTLDEYMAHLAYEGLDMRLSKLYKDEKEREKQKPRYLERLEREIKVIQEMGFSGYFLIVQDFIRWAKANGCPVGPGRGSGAGSLVAYSLEITDLDPLEYNLLFERFLNPERISMPDFDVDFCQDNRDRVIEYVKKKYGSEAVSQIATFGAMLAKGVIKDVGRVMDFSYSETDDLAKFIRTQPGLNITLQTALETEPEFRERVANTPEIKKLIESALHLEGICRNIGIHAGGVLIAPGKLTDFCPLYAANMLPENVVSMYDKKEVEDVGLVKFDFLGLTTLTIIARALDYIEKNTGKRPDLDHLPTNDKKIYENIFQKGETKMVFQFESPGMKNYVVRSVPEKLTDLIALNALYRPGPMELADDFVDLRKGLKEPEYADPRIIPVLEETSGIMLYQEQVMQVAQIIGGYSLGGADILRRAMGKKDAAEMDRQTKIFIEGAKKNGVSEQVATELFEKMRKFAQYGFNKSHAAAYSYVAYQTAWLKYYYPAEFTAANLCEVMINGPKLYEYIGDAYDHGLTVLPPDINQSDFHFTSPDSHTIRFGLGAIKGMGENTANAISAERKKNGPFKDMYDLTVRVGTEFISKKTLELLSLAGAFDSIDKNRRMWYESVEKVHPAAVAKEAAANQMGLFGEELEDPKDLMATCQPWDDIETLKQERSVFGFNYSGTLLDSAREEIAKQFKKKTLKEIQYRPEFGNRQRFEAFGVVTDVVQGVSKASGTHFIIVDVADGYCQVEMRVAPEIVDKVKKELKPDEIYLFEGVVSKPEKNENLNWIISNFAPISEVRARKKAKLFIRIDENAPIPGVAELLKGVGPVHHSQTFSSDVLVLERADDSEICMPLPKEYAVILSSENVSRLRNDSRLADVNIRYA